MGLHATSTAATARAAAPRAARSIGAVPAKRLAALVLGLLALAGATTPGALAAPSASSLAPARGVRAQIASTRGPSVSRALSNLQHSGAISATSYRQYLGAYVAAKHSVGRLSGTRRSGWRGGKRACRAGAGLHQHTSRRT